MSCPSRIALVLAMGMLVALMTVGWLFPGVPSPARLFSGGGIGSEELSDIQPNRWLQYDQPLYSNWRRQGHAGIAYDTRRATFYVFGSDIHGENWDNSVHEFDPQTRSWTTHYPAADPASYRVDDRGIGVSGDDGNLPWAMHTFDNVLYDQA